jgi:hypothetical protein
MSNKGVVLRYVDAFNAGDLARLRTIFTEDAVVQGVLEPTGKTYEIVAMEWFELRDGRIARRWGARDSASQARQIGLPLE